MKNKIIIGLVLVILMSYSAVYAEPSRELKDAMFSMTALGLVEDDMNLSKMSKGAITREEFAELVFNVYGFITKKDESSFGRLHKFTDVQSPKVISLYKLGIVKGTSRTTFSPRAKVTRQEMATMIMRTADSLGVDNKNAYQSAKMFRDNDSIAKWARKGVSYCRVNGILKGGTGNYYYPKSNATIGQVIIVQDRIYKLLSTHSYSVFSSDKKLNSYPVPSDNKSGILYGTNKMLGIDIRMILGDFENTANRDVYKQIFDMYGSLRDKVSIYDILALTKYIVNQWSVTDMSFGFDGEKYVKNGVVTSVMPSSTPYIRVESAGFMYVDCIR